MSDLLDIDIEVVSVSNQLRCSYCSEYVSAGDENEKGLRTDFVALKSLLNDAMWPENNSMILHP